MRFAALLPALFALGFGTPALAENNNITYLSDLDLSQVRQAFASAQKDKTIDNKPISIGGRKFDRGFGTHAESYFELDLKPGSERFKASVGVDDEVGKNGSVEFYVYGDSDLLWSSSRIRGGDAAKEIDVDISGKRRLLLVVTDGGDGLGFDHADWADARIVGKGADDLAAVAAPEAPYILTPKHGPEPRINGAKVFGVRPGNPFLFRIPATGERPMTFAVRGLPKGLKLDAATGIITGSVSKAGEYKMIIIAKNVKGQATRPFKVVVGEKIALTPPMGWNSWNCWGCEINEARVKAIADGYIKTDLVNHGWTYINVDDGWQARQNIGEAGQARKAPGWGLQPNEKFADMKALCDYVHGLGLKIGLYSTPWKLSYGNYTGGSGNDERGTIDRDKVVGKYTFEKQDANQWAAWGIDYMKYDWAPIDVDNTRRMADALRACGRDIVFSLSNGANIKFGDKWGELAQLWRTTGDISDQWTSVSRIGFSQDPWKSFAGPGHWNDPDMLVVGHVGWGSPRPSRLTPNEQYAHVSLWCLLSAPLLLGCDLSQADDFTINLLSNDEVLEVDQDSLGRAAGRISANGGLEVWAKDMEDGSKAVGLFNTSLFPARVTAKWSDLGLTGSQRVRDLWRQKDLGTFADAYSAEIPRHGVVLIRIWPAKAK